MIYVNKTKLLLMKDKYNFETYLFLSPKKIAISVHNKQNLENLYQNEIIVDNKIDLDLVLVDKFLEQNVYQIEKVLNNFVENISLILNTNKFLTVRFSLKKSNYGNLITREKLSYLLSEAKVECKKTIGDRNIIHMLINNYLIDNKSYSSFPENLKCDYFSLDISFICLSKNHILNLENVLKKYQISVNNILNFDYVNSFLNESQNNLYRMSMQINDGYNENEVLIVPKKRKNRGFFERFFNFFN